MTKKFWDFDRWNDGYVNKGRFKVYRPDYPRSRCDGWVLRTHVVWWLVHGTVHPPGTQLHHRNEDKLDDRIENLVPLTPREHQREHARLRGGRVGVSCKTCGKKFERSRHKIRYGNAYCSSRCYQAVPKSLSSREKRSSSMKLAYALGRKKPRGFYKVLPSQRSVIYETYFGSDLNIKQIAERFGISSPTVRQILEGV